MSPETIVIACVILISSEECVLETNGHCVRNLALPKEFWPSSSGGPSERSVFVIHVGLLKSHLIIYGNMSP